MEIKSSKTYEVTKFTASTVCSLGLLPGADVKRLLKGYEYDATYEMWFTPRANCSYDVAEIED